MTRLATEICRSCMRRLSEAAALFLGDFMSGFSLASVPFEEWLVVHRERLHRQALEALHHLAAYDERRGHFDRVIYYAQRQVELEPWDERAQRQVMRLLALSGQRNADLAQYETCRTTFPNWAGTNWPGSSITFCPARSGWTTTTSATAPRAPKVTVYLYTGTCSST